ncbi:hypothetical protein [Georgenia muralis]
MSETSDGIEEAFEGAMRVAVTVAARTGELLARAREEQQRRTAAVDEQRARELTERLRAEQAAARAELAPVFRTEWWERAGVEDVQRAYTTAKSWAGREPEADRAAARIRDEVRSRYGVDVDSAAADPELVRVALERAEARRAEAERERARASEDQVEAQLLVAEAGRADQAAEAARAAAEHEPEDVREEAAIQAELEPTRAMAAREAGKDNYDSAERRQALAADLARRGIDQETVAARMTADVSQGTHPSAAVKAAAGKKAPKARKNRSSKQRQHELSR